MSKTKSKLRVAKEKFVKDWGDDYWDMKRFLRQLNNLIRLAKREALEQHAREEVKKVLKKASKPRRPENIKQIPGFDKRF